MASFYSSRFNFHFHYFFIASMHLGYRIWNWIMNKVYVYVHILTEEKKMEWLKDIIRFVCEKWGIIQLQLTSPHFLWKIINCNWRRCQLNLLLNLLSATYLWSTNTHKRDCEGEKILENHHMLFLLFLFSLLRYVKVRIMFTCLRDC